MPCLITALTRSFNEKTTKKKQTTKEAKTKISRQNLSLLCPLHKFTLSKLYNRWQFSLKRRGNKVDKRK